MARWLNVRHPALCIKTVKKLENDHLQNHTIGFYWGGTTNAIGGVEHSGYDKNEHMLEQQVGHLHVSCNSLHCKQSSNVMNCGDSYKQLNQICTELQMADANHSVYYIQEFMATWPKNANETTSSDGYSLSLVGTKTLLVRTREVMKPFYPNVDKDTYSINGPKLGNLTGG